jgi:nitrogen fixation protein FixH
MAAAATQATTRPKQRSLWAYVPVVLLLSMLAGLGWLASIAVDDPSFAVEKDYYQKAVSWDRELEQQRQNVDLGWQTELRLLNGADDRVEAEVVIVDRMRARVSDARVSLEAFPNVRAEERLNLKLEPSGTGSYRTAFTPRRGGLWEFRVQALRRAEQYTHVTRQDLPARSLP